MLKGSLDDFSLPDIFRLMSFAKKTGKLDITRSAGEGHVYFREGEVYYAESSLTNEPLGQKLIHNKALTEGQLRKALDQSASSGERVGRVLVESGVVGEDAIEAAVRQQIEDAAFDLLRWELGEFEWLQDDGLEVEVPIYVSVENLIMEASRRLDELEVIQRKIPSSNVVLAMAATPPDGAVEINITPEEWRLLVLVNGTRSVSDIAQMGGLDDFAAMRMLYGLVSAGLIEVAGSAEDYPAEEVDDQEELAAETEVADEVAAAPDQEEPAAEAEVADVVAAAPEVEPEEEEPAAETEVADEFEATTQVAPEADEAEAASVGPEGEGVLAPSVDFDADALFREEFNVASPDEYFETEQVAEPVAAADAPAAPEEEETDADLPVESFDQPTGDELVTQAADQGETGGSFLNDLLADAQAEPEAPSDAPEPVAETETEAEAETEADIPVSAEPEGDSPRVDRAAVVRELAGLFDDDRPRTKAAASKGDAGGAGDERKRVEDDDQVTRGIISRLIDGVKGL